MRKTILFLLFFGFYQSTNAQCSIEQFFPNATFNASMADEVGQSFKACSFANIDSLIVKLLP